jgi:hypothetical protein
MTQTNNQGCMDLPSSPHHYEIVWSDNKSGRALLVCTQCANPKKIDIREFWKDEDA